LNVRSIEPESLIWVVAEKLKPEIEPPEWAGYVKTGVHKERSPVQKDWWWVRGASVLRKVYLKGPLGTERLAAEYGGKVDRGSKPYRARKGSRSVIRHLLQQLTDLGYLEKSSKGRGITEKGKKLLEKCAEEVVQGEG